MLAPRLCRMHCRPTGADESIQGDACVATLWSLLNVAHELRVNLRSAARVVNDPRISSAIPAQPPALCSVQGWPTLGSVQGLADAQHQQARTPAHRSAGHYLCMFPKQ